MKDPADRSAPNAFDPDGPRDTAAFREGSALGGATQEDAQLYRLLVESVREYAIFALDRTGHVLTWNPGAERFKGWKAEEIIGRHFSTFYPPEDIAAGKPSRELREAERLGSIEDDGWRLRKDGTRFWANVTITALRDDSGQLIGFAKVTRDMTERRAAEQLLRENEARFRLIVQSVKDYAIFMLDPNGRVATWNEGAEAIKGYTANEIIGQHFSVFYPQDAIVTQFPQYELKVATATGRFEDEGWRVRKDGSLFWASVIITALRDETGKLVGFAKVTRDLTERRRAQERALADARRVADMEASNRAKSEFLATLSHELRTPLNAIGGYADLLVLAIPGDINDTQKLYIDRIKTAQQHLLALVNDLLNLSRVEAGAMEYDIQRVDVHRLFADLDAMILPQARAKNIDFAVMDCTGDAALEADPARTQQILLNLLSNAVKFTPEGGRISLACSVTDGQIGISVIDTGPGIPQDKHEAIFEPFVQLGRSLTNPREGIGLGLAISRDLARAMNGDLKVSSRLGEGSTFTLILPRYTAA
jgi:PAS domain S-box-containing protein